MELYKKLVKEPLEFGLENGSNGIPLPKSLPILNKFTNNINRAMTIALGGKSNAGKTSYMDFVYMINVYKWWKEQPVSTRPPLKFIYFNMKHTMRNKFQKWVCLFVKIIYDEVIDINTLNSGVGKLFELSDATLERIKTAEDFFEEMESEGILTLVDGQQTPTSIYNKVCNTMTEYGTLSKDKKTFTLKDGYKKLLTMVFVDNADYLLSETDGYSMMNPDQLKKKLSDYVTEFKNVYSITSIIVVISKSFGKNIKENEPNYKELGVFGVKIDLAIIFYNPFNENNNKFCGYEADKFNFGGKTRLRMATIVRNVNGVENLTKGLIFLGECGYFTEAPSPHEELDIIELQTALARLP